MDPNQKNNKKWHKVRIFDKYEDANELRHIMLNNDETGLLEMKIYRCGPDGSKFKLKKYFPRSTK